MDYEASGALVTLWWEYYFDKDRIGMLFMRGELQYRGFDIYETFSMPLTSVKSR